MQKTYERLISFMFEAVYRNPKAKGEEGKARDLVKYLYTHFTAHVEKMPGRVPPHRRAGGRRTCRLRLYLRHERPLCSIAV